MGLPTVTQTWTMSFNNRSIFVSIIRTMGDLVFSLKNFLKTTMGYTVKGSCDGTTGAMDGVDRITSATTWATRNNGAAGAMSWIVLTDGAGIDWCFSFNSSSDAIVRLAHSTGGNYVAAATPNQQPTASDECFDVASSEWVNANNTSRPSDTVWHMWGSSDKKMWRLVTATGANLGVTGHAFCAYIAGEKFTSALIAPASFTLGTGGGTVGAIKTYYQGGNGNGGRIYSLATILNVIYTGSSVADLCRVRAGGADTNALATIGGEQPGGAVGAVNGGAQFWSAEKPALQGHKGQLIFPTTMGARNASADGKLGTKIDHWSSITNVAGLPEFLDSYGDKQFWAIAPGIILPGDGVTRLVSQ
jgi:hypothetical protein